jgi:hypothetical protein
MQYFQLPIINKINWFLCLLVLILNSSVYAQETDDELPESFYGNWVEDLSQCEGVSLFSIDYSVDGVLVSGLDWYSTEVKVENRGDFYTLFIKAESEDGEFQSEINIKMGEEGELIIINPESEDAKLVKCELLMQADFPEEELEVDSVQLEVIETVEEVVDLEVLGESGVEVEELDMENSTDLEIVDIELLQGTWQSLEDEDSFMVIEGDRMKNYYGGMDEELDNEAFMLSDTCMNESDSENGLPEEKNRYLSNPNLDMCWYIESLDATNLTLVYMARGNKITYRRVE